MALQKLLSNELKLVSIHMYEVEDPEYRLQLRIVKEANERLGIGEDPLVILMREEEDLDLYLK